MKSNYYTCTFTCGMRKHTVKRLAFSLEDYRNKIRREWGKGAYNFIFIEKELVK